MGHRHVLKYFLITMSNYIHLKQWKETAVESHFSGEYPWIEIQDKIKFILKNFLGCKASELAIMNALSVNLHLLMISFFNLIKSKLTLIECY